MAAYNKIPAVLPKLPFAYNALEPAISSQIMELHHSKHHATYVANFNKAHEDIQAASQAQDIKKQIALQATVKFNGGGHINHTLFWENLAPQSQGGGQFPSSGKLHDQVQQDFGGLDGFEEGRQRRCPRYPGIWMGLARGTTRRPRTLRLSRPQPGTRFSATFPPSAWTCGSTLTTSTTRSQGLVPRSLSEA
uniref:superoxide dismutase n=1 Tax=Rhodotorula glutinis TaxID=5535 RepID=Q96UQ8_RHOGU|nr:superoxide dismutase [Rhodotorula glutinis]